MKMYSEEVAAAELGRVGAIEDFDLGMKEYPYELLSCRNFELLIYALFKRSGPPDQLQSTSWDRVSLAARGSDHGRDVVLLDKETMVGVVQCKGERQRVSLPAVLRELAKTILHLNTDKALRSEISGLMYCLVSANEPARTVVDFFSSPSVVLNSQDDILGAAVEAVVGRYKALGEVDLGEAKQFVADSVRGMSLSLLRPVDLNMWLSKARGTAATFFRPGSILIEDSAARELREGLAEIRQRTAGIPLMEDADLRVIKRYIEAVPETHRLSLGFVSLFGFPRSMFSGDSGEFRRRITPISDLMQDLNMDYMAWMFDQAYAEAERISNRLDVMVQVHPFARQIPRSFLGSLVGDLIVRTLQGEVLAGITQKSMGMQSFVGFDDRMEHLKATLLEEGRRYLVEDYSQVVGEGDLLVLKLKLIRFSMEGIGDEAELEHVLEAGETALRPYLIESASKLEELGAHRPSVFMMGMSGLDDSEQISRMGQTLKALDEMKG